MLKILSLLIVGSLALAAAPKPNIVFIIADDLGYGDLGCFGQKKTQTPVLDKLAAEGIRFTQHYSGSTVCAPSRSSLMTGLDTGSTWLRGNGEFELRPDPEDLTVRHPAATRWLPHRHGRQVMRLRQHTESPACAEKGMWLWNIRQKTL